MRDTEIVITYRIPRRFWVRFWLGVWLVRVEEET